MMPTLVLKLIRVTRKNIMKIHSMKLDKLYFEEVAIGSKVIEIRLNDRKRENIRVGDQITFYNRENPQNFVSVKVKNVQKFVTLLDLLSAYPIANFGRVWKSINEGIDAVNYYSENDIRKYGFLAIEIEAES
tara:strand:+ start:39 stop:434 length:396 start_codon:yes stop_codon:yes gene_type:complete